VVPRVGFLIAFTPAQVSGVGDSSAHVREMTAICKKQRRDEAPPTPDMRLPEYPSGANAGRDN
jgi:hypothetical protein